MFVCIPGPITRSGKPDSGPFRYRTLHPAAPWKTGERPQLKAPVLAGDVGLAIRLVALGVSASVLAAANAVLLGGTLD